MYQRYIANPIKEALKEALKDTPVILINGARQTGKSTLCRQLVEEGNFDGQIRTMDDPTTLAASQADPLGFLEDLSPHAIIDEVQRAPELFLSIKKVVDQNRKERRLILYGQRLTEWRRNVESFCARHGVSYVPIDTGVSVETLLFDILRRRNVVR